MDVYNKACCIVVEIMLESHSLDEIELRVVEIIKRDIDNAFEPDSNYPQYGSTYYQIIMGLAAQIGHRKRAAALEEKSK